MFQHTFSPGSFSPEMVYEMTVGSAIMFRFSQATFVFFGLFFVVLGVFFWGVGSAQDLYVSGVRFIPLDAQRVLFPVVSILAGALIIIVSVRARDTIMLADAHGIRKRWLLGNTFIP